MLKLIDVEELQPGMFVVKVTKQSGKIKVTSSGKVKSENDIITMKQKGVLQVQIDLSKSSHLQQEDTAESEDDYVGQSGLSYQQQLEHALKLHDQAKGVHGRLMKQISKGKIANLAEVNDITQDIVDKAFECEDALNIVTLLKESDEYFLEHSINCSILIVMFGRTLELDQDTLLQLGLGALLMDIGMVKLPLLLTQKSTALSAEENIRMQRHVEIALDLIDSLTGVEEICVSVVKHHHERLDGSGYPAGLRDQQISLYGRMAAIVDTYDSLTTQRPYREALKPSEALRKMAQENLGLDPELMQQFVTCVGANPVGSLVKLTSGKIAMVMRLNKQQPLKPVVMVFYNLTTRMDEVARVDLSKVEDEIISSVSPDDFGVSLPAFLHQAFF